MTCPYEPLNEFLIVKPESATEQQIGGIVMPGTVNLDMLRAKVVATRPGSKIKEGDTVLYLKQNGGPIPPTKLYSVVREVDLLCREVEGTSH